MNRRRSIRDPSNFSRSGSLLLARVDPVYKAGVGVGVPGAVSVRGLIGSFVAGVGLDGGAYTTGVAAARS